MKQITTTELLSFYFAKWTFSNKLEMTMEEQAVAYKSDDRLAYKSLLLKQEHREVLISERNKEVFKALKNKTITQVRNEINKRKPK